MKYRIYPLGESAVTIDFGNHISIKINDFVHQLSNIIEQKNFSGLIECVPAYSSLTVFYDVMAVRQNSGFANSFIEIKDFIENSVKQIKDRPQRRGKTHEIPISFNKEFALDLDFVAKSNNLKPKDVVDIFLEKSYRVFMLGFLPGFAYLGKIDKRIQTPRKQVPRKNIPRGSVGIAGRQTGIYPLNSPGGWQIIGKTEIELFSSKNEKNPTLLKAGDRVKFIEI